MAKIVHIDARQILDSRGNPTVEADVFLADGSVGRAAVPSGASTGTHEALELRDGEKAYGGQGVLQAVHTVTTEIFPAVADMDAGDQQALDAKMIELDGTPNKARLGANAILAVSLAAAKAEAESRELMFFEHVQTLSSAPREPVLPLPMCNLINGGRHAALSTDVQEFMVMPVGASTFHEAMQMTSEVFHALKGILSEKGYTTTVGDEGGFAPAVKGGNKEALELLVKAVERAGYALGTDFVFAIDVAASELYDGKLYTLRSENKKFTREELLEFYSELTQAFPLVSIEDGLHEDDWQGWATLNKKLGAHTQIVGDDFLVTNMTFLKRAIEMKAANTILIKPNQIGTLSETIKAVDTAHSAGWKAVVSHRSGETEDTSIAHIAVGLGTGQIKTGSLSRGERTAKYNELLRIEAMFG